MGAAPLVSVRIPSYNHEKYIHDCISSILDQTFQDFEIVIVDDCSTDETVNEIKKFKDPRIKLEVLSRNSGMNVAVERCMRNCSGKYIANISSDDMWEPTKLEKQVGFLENNTEYDAVFSRVEFIGEDSDPLDITGNKYENIFDCENRNSRQWLRRFFYQGNCLCNPSVMIKRDVYQSFRYQDKRLVSLSDFNLWVQFSFKHQLWILDEKLTKFRIRDEEKNLSADSPGNRNRLAFEFKQILDHYLSINTTEFLLEIFPECVRYGEPKETTIPYFLGRLAIDAGFVFHRLWGCEKIFSLLSDEAAVTCLEKYCDFRYTDFLQLTKTTDFFGLLNPSPEVQASEDESAEGMPEGSEIMQDETEIMQDETEIMQEEAQPEPMFTDAVESDIIRRNPIYETSKRVLKRISPRLFDMTKRIYLGLKH